MNLSTKKCILLLLSAAFSIGMQAQSIITVKGKVTDQNNEPVIGATVTYHGTKTAVVTDFDGHYSISVADNGTLDFAYIGMKAVSQDVQKRQTINITMTEDVSELNDVIVVGYGTQKRGSITGSVSALRGKEMLKTNNENTQNMLTGRIAGVRVWQQSSEPGTYRNNFDVRGLGAPLIVIDGVPRSVEDFQRMNANDIEDISVLKDASAAIYGLRAANGVLLVTTKKGGMGKTQVSYSGSFTIQAPKSMPKLLDPVRAMTLMNELKKNNIDGGAPMFTEEAIDEYRNGTKQGTNWNDLIFAETAPETNHNMTISGGSDKMQYFVSMGYLYQEGFLKSGDLNYDKFNITSKINAEIVKGLDFELQINGMLDNRNNPYTSTTDIIRNYWRQGPLAAAYADPEHTMLNYQNLDLGENAVAEMTADISGYRKYKRYQMLTQGTLTFDFGKYVDVLKGLTARAMYSYDFHMDKNEIYRRQYNQYAYDPVTDSYIQQVYSGSSPAQLRKEHYDNTQKLMQFTLNYNRTISSHTIGAMIGLETQQKVYDGFYARRNLAFNSPYLFNGVDEGQVGNANAGDIHAANYNSFIGRLNYNYADRYLVEGQFRYDGSSQFAPGHRWGFFPSASAGWRVSEEPFFKNIDALHFIQNLKVRASYGEMGDDSGASYDWVAGYSYPSGGSGDGNKGWYNGYAPGWMFGGQFIYGASPKAMPNESISWYKSKSFNIGFDFTAWDGKLGITFDYFIRKRTGLYMQPGDFPTVIGADAPRLNANSDQHMGVELEISHRNRIGEVNYGLKGIFSLTRNKYLTAVQNATYANSYDKWRHDNLNNRYQGVQFGYTSAGRFTSWEDIWNYDIYHERDVLPGDYKYEDWNGDGEINGLDEHPFAYDQTPWMNYSFNIDANWRNFDLNILFQGSAMGSMRYEEPLYRIWGYEAAAGGTLEQFWDRWHPVDPTADPWDPTQEWVSGYYAYTNHNPYGNSEFNRVSTAYLRLKSVELGYTLPKMRALNGVSLRIYANAYNLLTFTGVKFVDPEHPDSDLGRLYPLNKTYTFGLQLSF